MTKEEISYALDALRAVLDARPGITEKRMFGGQFFMLNGNMMCNIGKNGYMFRVGVDREAQALDMPGAKQVVQAKRPKPGFIHVEPAAAIESGLEAWVDLTAEYIGAMSFKETKKD